MASAANLRRVRRDDPDRSDPPPRGAARTPAPGGSPDAPPRPQLLAAPDKFRGTASAAEVARAACGAANATGWGCTPLPLADGGEGTLEAVGGEPRRTTVSGPFGEPVEAEWRLVPGVAGTPPTAVIEMARAAGRALVPPGRRGAAVRASTTGVGELIAAAVHAGAERVVVACGGSATTDGGLGAVSALGGPQGLAGTELLAAVDVSTRFLDAARVFGPQKGATPEEVDLLERRLAALAQRYATFLGVDVTPLPGSGAAGGLAGGLAALGGRIVSGFDLVAELAGLDAQSAGADLVLTGEGRLDATSLEGKVVSGVVGRVASRLPVLVVAGTVEGIGAADLAATAGVTGATITVVDLVARFGTRRAFEHAAWCVAEAVREHLATAGRPGAGGPP